MGITFSQKEYVLFYKEQKQQQLFKKRVWSGPNEKSNVKHPHQ